MGVEEKDYSIGNLETQLTIRSNTIEQLNEQISSSSGSYKDRIMSLNKTTQDLMSQVDEKTLELQKQHTDLGTLQVKLNQQENAHKRDLTSKQQEIVELKDKLSEFQSKIEALDVELNDRQKHFESEIEAKSESEEK